MPTRAARFCRAPGCGCIVIAPEIYCANHIYIAREKEKTYDARRGSSNARGYTSRWRAYSRQFLRAPGHQFCALRLDENCNILAECVDHIDPPDSPHDPRFWDKSNHQPACIHCNSIKGHRRMRGAYVFGGEVRV